MHKNKMFFYSLICMSFVSFAAERKEPNAVIAWCKNNEGNNCLDRATYTHRSAKCAHLFGLFDGHSGARTVEHLSEKLPSYFEAQNDSNFGNNITHALKIIDEEVKSFQDGSTAVVVNIGDGKCSIAHVGDSRLLLLDFGLGKNLYGIKHVTQDHSAQSNDFERVKKAGGYYAHENGYRYVYAYVPAEDGLAMTRTIGDHDVDPGKQVFIPVPDCAEFDLADLSDDSYLVMATDGLWDQLSDVRASSVVRAGLSRGNALSKIAKALVQEAMFKNSTDDITCMLVKIKALAMDTQACVEEIELARPTTKE
jgi:protein phosphatase PTC2/3